MRALRKMGDAQRAARIFGCSVEQAKALYRKNAEQLAQMAEKAEDTGGRYNGYTAAELREKAKAFEEKSR
jgi:hypothetical protein